MKHKPDMKKLARFIGEDPSRKVLLAQEFKLTTTDAIDKWQERGRLPAPRRAQILKFMRINSK